MNTIQRLIILLGLIGIFLSALYPRWEAVVPMRTNTGAESPGRFQNLAGETQQEDLRVFLGRRMVFYRPGPREVLLALSANLNPNAAQRSLIAGNSYRYENGELRYDAPSLLGLLNQTVDFTVTAPVHIFIQVPETVLELLEWIFLTTGLWLLFYPGARHKRSEA